MAKKIIKTKDRVRDHGEVFTPNFIVDEMLDLVKHETERIESRFLEPACGDGNFLIEVLKRKLIAVKTRYKKNQHELEKYYILALGSIYGIDLLEDNVVEAQKRLYDYVVVDYNKLYKKSANEDFLKSAKYVLSKNIIQGNALTLKNEIDVPILFSEWSLIGSSKIKRRDFYFGELINNEDWNSKAEDTLFGDTGNPAFIPQPIRDFPPIYFLNLHSVNDGDSIQSGRSGRTSKPEQGGGIYSSQSSKSNVRSFAKRNLVR